MPPSMKSWSRRPACRLWPNVIGKDLIFSGSLITAIVLCAIVFGAAGPSGPSEPTLIHTAPKPDFYFLPIYASLALLPAVPWRPSCCW